MQKLRTFYQQRFEILAVILTALLKFIFMDWLNWRAFYIAGFCLFWIVYIIFRVRNDVNILHVWGFKKEYFREAFLFLTGFIFLSIMVSILYGHFNKSLYFTWHIIPIFILYPVWGIIQQFLMLAIISRNLVNLPEIKINKFVLIFIVSGLFSLIHYPSASLMIYTFFMEVIFVTVYLKWGNLWAIGIAHGWAATFLLFYVNDRDLWLELMNGI